MSTVALTPAERDRLKTVIYAELKEALIDHCDYEQQPGVFHLLHDRVYLAVAADDLVEPLRDAIAQPLLDRIAELEWRLEGLSK